MGISRKSTGNLTGWELDGNLTGICWDSDMNLMGIWLESDRNLIGIGWEYHWNLTGIWWESDRNLLGIWIWINLTRILWESYITYNFLMFFIIQIWKVWGANVTMCYTVLGDIAISILTSIYIVFVPLIIYVKKGRCRSNQFRTCYHPEWSHFDYTAFNFAQYSWYV